MSAIQLKPGREKSLIRRHPWVFSGAIAGAQGAPSDGETVQILDAKGNFLAWGAYSSQSQIRARVWSWDPEEPIDLSFFRERLEKAIAMRSGLALSSTTNAYRLVHAESDGLPGLIVDRYGTVLVVQILSSGPERWRRELVDLLVELTRAEGIYERSDVDVRRLEGLPLRTGSLSGSIPNQPVKITEEGLNFWVDILHGHKTGHYLDQRENRRRLRELAAGRQVLDCFCYSGGFAANALAGGAQTVLCVDSSAEALALARNNLELNGLRLEQVDFVEADVFQALRGFRDRGSQFDLIILDPPKFAQTASQAERAARGYKDINLLAFKLLRPGGLLVTFSCSGGVSEDLFQKIVAGAALDAGVDGRIVERLHQGADHPVALNFPEGAYLKGLVIEVV